LQDLLRIKKEIFCLNDLRIKAVSIKTTQLKNKIMSRSAKNEDGENEKEIRKIKDGISSLFLHFFEIWQKKPFFKQQIRTSNCTD
jgi:hypothetical protein